MWERPLGLAGVTGLNSWTYQSFSESPRPSEMTEWWSLIEYLILKSVGLCISDTSFQGAFIFFDLKQLIYKN